MIRDRLRQLVWWGLGLAMTATLLVLAGYGVTMQEKVRHEQTKWLRDKLVGLNVITMDVLYDTTAVVHPGQWKKVQEAISRKLAEYADQDNFWPQSLLQLDRRLQQRMEHFLQARATCRGVREAGEAERCRQLLERLATQVRLTLQDLFVEVGMLERKALQARERLFFWGGILMLFMLSALAFMILVILVPLGRRLDTGLAMLLEAAHSFTRSDRVIPIEVDREDELGILARAFNEMMEHRLAVEEALKRSEANLAEAQQVAHLGSWELDLLNNRLWWSDEIYRIFEIDREKFGASYEAFLERVHPEDRELVDRAYRKSVEEHTFYEVIHRLRMEDGRIKYVRERGRTDYSEDGTPLRSIGTVQDVTEQELALRALRESEQELDAIIENLPLMVFLKDAESGRFVRFNRAGEKLLGIERKRIIGHTDHEIFPSEQAAAFVADDRRVLESGEILDVPMEVVDTAQGRRYLHTRKVRICTTEGKPRFLLGIAEDITERMEAEQRVRHRLALEAVMARISTELAQAGEEELDGLLQHALEEIGRAFQADRSYLYQMDPEARSWKEGRQWCWCHCEDECVPDSRQLLPASNHEALLQRFQQGELLHLTSPEAAGEAFPDLRRYMEENRIHSLVQVPVVLNGELLGVVGFDAGARSRSWPEEDVRLLRIVAEAIANAIIRVRSSRAIREHTWYLEGLDRISRILAENTLQVPMLEKVVEAVLDLFGADRAWVLKAVETGAPGYEVPIECTRPEYPGAVASELELPDDEFSRRMMERLMGSSEPLTMHLREVEQLPDYLKGYQIQSQMLVAIRPTLGAPWILGIHQCSSEREWTPVEQRLFRAIAERVGIALVGVRLMEEIRESEQRLQEAEKIAQVGSWELDLRTGKAYWSDQEYRCLGYQPGGCEAGYEAFERAVHPEDRQWVNDAVARAVNGEVSEYDIQHRVVWPDGSVHVVHELAQVTRDESGKPVRMIGTTQDITQRVALEQELERHKRHLEELVAERTRTIRRQAKIIEQTNDAVVTTDPDGRITSWNQGAQRVFGYSAQEALGQSVELLYPKEYREKLPAELWARLQEKGTLEREVELLRRDGSSFPAFLSLSLLRDESGKVDGVVGYAVDISELRRREQELKRLAERLEASNRELESFSYSVSHDLRAPLRAIDGFSQALEEDYGAQLDEVAHDYLRRIRGGAQRLGILIDDLLQLSRVNREALRLEPVDLTEMARSVIEELRAGEPQRQVELVVDPEMVVTGDPRLLRALVANLLGNAWKFTGKEERARIEFRRVEGKEGVFFVADNGVGFDMRHARKLFGAFQRLHRAKEFPGTGIGLATVQRIVHRHGGRVWAEAEPGKGARFYFSLATDLQEASYHVDREQAEG